MAPLYDLGRKRDCERIVEAFQDDLRPEADKHYIRAAALHAEIRKLEDALRALDKSIAQRIFDNMSVVTTKRARRPKPLPRKGRSRTDLDEQMEEAQNALEGLEFGFKLGDDIQIRSLDELERDGAELKFRNPASRQILLDRLDEAREELLQIEASLETLQGHFEELRRRFTMNRCSDYNISPALMMHFPPPRP